MRPADGPPSLPHLRWRVRDTVSSCQPYGAEAPKALQGKTTKNTNSKTKPNQQKKNNNQNVAVPRPLTEVLDGAGLFGNGKSWGDVRPKRNVRSHRPKQGLGNKS